MDEENIVIIAENQALPPLPDKTMPLSAFYDLIYKFAVQIGYEGDKETFANDFLNALNGMNGCNCNTCSCKQVFFFNGMKEFPVIGEENNLYVNTSKNIIYIWNGGSYEPVGKGDCSTIPDKRSLTVGDINKLVVSYVETLSPYKIQE